MHQTKHGLRPHWHAARYALSALSLFSLTAWAGPSIAAQCAPAALTVVPVQAFTAYAPQERMVMHFHRSSDQSQGHAQLDIRLGTNTDQHGQYTRQHLHRIAARTYIWTLTYDGSGNGTLSLRDPSIPLPFRATYTATVPPGLRVGNALKLQLAGTTQDAPAKDGLALNDHTHNDHTPHKAGAAITLRDINGLPTQLTLTTPGHKDSEAQTLVVVYATRTGAFTASGALTLLQTKSRSRASEFAFSITAGNVQCQSTGLPPSISSPLPAPDTVLAADALPNIGATFRDNGSGVATASARLLIDGVDQSAQALVTATGISYRPVTPLAEGNHTIVVNVANTAGQAASLSWGFVTRTEPSIPDVTPQDIRTTQLRPRVQVAYTDIGAGVEPALTRLTLNGADVTALASVTATGIEFQPAADLAVGEQILSVSVTDKVGNTRTRTWKFTIVAEPLPPEAPGERGRLPMPGIKVYP